jgi:NAD(P)-dependent dehydrogenase (short-subunit alcohol dehydrogenase family)
MKPAQQKIVIVGGSSGIGLAAAQRLDREGYRVVITARIEARIDEALRRIGGAVSGQTLDYAPVSFDVGQHKTQCNSRSCNDR